MISASRPELHGQASAAWRCVVFLLCIPSAGALLLKVYGLMPMREAFLWLALPCAAVLFYLGLGVGRMKGNAIAEAIRVGAFGGLMGTFGYDLIRIPFHYAGWRLYAAINVYGIWITDADASSAFTDAVGWSYHFYNGIAFGIMYAVFFRGRAITWAVIWGLVLETIAIFAPSGSIFGVYGNSPLIAIFYLGHVAYGIPLGYLVREWPDAVRWLGQISPVLRYGTIGLLAMILLATLGAGQFVPSIRAQTQSMLRIDGEQLQPAMVRIRSKAIAVRVENPDATPREVIVKQTGARTTVPPKATASLYFANTGIFQVHLATSGRTRSSLVIVEPVEDRP